MPTSYIYPWSWFSTSKMALNTRNKLRFEGTVKERNMGGIKTGTKRTHQNAYQVDEYRAAYAVTSVSIWPYLANEAYWHRRNKHGNVVFAPAFLPKVVKQTPRLFSGFHWFCWICSWMSPQGVLLTLRCQRLLKCINKGWISCLSLQGGMNSRGMYTDSIWVPLSSMVGNNTKQYRNWPSSGYQKSTLTVGCVWSLSYDTTKNSSTCFLHTNMKIIFKELMDDSVVKCHFNWLRIIAKNVHLHDKFNNFKLR